MPEEPEAAASFGANAWLVDEMYEQYRQDPNSVSESWQEFFADYRTGSTGRGGGNGQSAPAEGDGLAPAASKSEAPRGGGAAPAATAPAAAKPAAPAPTPAAPAPAAPAPAAPAAPAPAAPAPAAAAPAPAAEPLRRAAARIAANMKASIAV